MTKIESRKCINPESFVRHSVLQAFFEMIENLCNKIQSTGIPKWDIGDVFVKNLRAYIYHIPSESKLNVLSENQCFIIHASSSQFCGGNREFWCLTRTLMMIISIIHEILY